GLVQGAGEASRWCLITAIAGLGIKTKLGDFVKVGWRPAALILTETLFIMIFVLTLLLTV
ncbi:MAG TPA: putative sulfate exporter family transporter, partial [Alphaproteobacteria bacterium]|nr:putative sulfate exporter family transporter [Alphaproteobacteria bacterium]